MALLLALGSLSAARTAAAQGCTWEWATTGGGSQGSDFFDRVTTDASGHVFVAGRMRKTATYGDTTLTAPGNQEDLIVAKLTPTGAYEWIRRAGSATNDELTTLRVGTNGNVYIEGFCLAGMTFGSNTLPASGPTAGAGYVACLDGATGSWLWAVRTPANSFSSAMVLDAANNVYVAGAFTDTATFGSTQLVCATPLAYNPFVAKLAGTGTHPWQWAKSVVSTADERVTALATDHAGNLYVGGHFRASTIQFGTTTLTNAGSQDCFVAKLSTAGAWRWARQLGGAPDEVINDIDATAAGVVVGGYFRGVSSALNSTVMGSTTLANAGRFNTYDGYLAKLSTAGAVQWATRIGGTAGDIVRTVDLAPTGEVYVTGDYHSVAVTLGDSTYANLSANTSLADAYAVRLSATGADWEVLGRATGTNCEFMLGAALDPAGNFYVSGCFASVPNPANLGPFSVLSTGYFDAFVVKIAPASSPTGLTGGTARAGVTLWPNPAHAAVRVAGTGGAAVELLDALGRVVLTAHPAIGTEPTLQLTGLPPGVYSVRVDGEVRRLVVD